MKAEPEFKKYYRHVEKHVKAVQSEMGLGIIKTEETLVQHIERISAFNSQEKAFAFFNTKAPYQWKEYINETELKRFDYDLGALVLYVANTVVSIDVFRKIQHTPGYEFLIGEGKTKSFRLKDGTRLILKEHWKVDERTYDRYMPLELDVVEEQVLTTYEGKVSEVPVYVMTHPDPALFWIGESVVPKPSKEITHYEEGKTKTLSKYGCPEDQLWLTEVQAVEEFETFFHDQISDPIGFYDLHRFHFVIYYHQAGEILQIAGFNTEKEFQKGCKAIADFLK